MPHYLIRHAQATYDEDDRVRALSARGRVQVERLVEALGLGFRPAQVWHSPLVRSRETAELLVRGLGLSVPFLEKADLCPDSDPHPITALLEAATEDIAVFGHEPNLSILAASLIRGGTRAGTVGFAKGGTLALRRGDMGRWVPEWLVRAP